MAEWWLLNALGRDTNASYMQMRAQGKNQEQRKDINGFQDAVLLLFRP